MRRSTARSAIGMIDDVSARVIITQPATNVANGCVARTRQAATTSAMSTTIGTRTASGASLLASGQS